MTKSKKLSIFIFSFLLALASIVFVACGKLDYSKTYLSSSSGDFIELFVSDEKEFTITIENPVDKMNKGISFTQSNPLVASIKQVASQNNSTTFSVTGLSGGSSKVEFLSVEGRKNLSVTINVKEFSDELKNGDNSLYISKTSKLVPTSSDFKFKESSTERNLEFYFFGQNNSNATLTESDISSNNGLINNFVELEVYSYDGKDYLIFKDKDGLLYTLGQGTLVVNTGNIRYNFIEVQENEYGFIFETQNATAVEKGQKFSFLARYKNEKLAEVEGEGVFFCERQFSFLNDILAEDISHEYGYKINEINYVAGRENTSYKIDQLKSGEITLIPNYTTDILDNPLLVGNTANYLTVYLEVSIKSNDLLKFEFNTKDSVIANSKLLTTLKSGENTIYYLEVNCGIGSAKTTSLDVNFYYEGFENSQDSKVNFVYSIPIEIRIIPTKLLINNVDFSQVDKIYKFYNYYASQDAGWQAFNFTVIPEGAEYDNLILDLTNSGLQVKYMNIIYTTGLLEITNLKETVYIKGANNVEITSQTQMLPVVMNFNIIQKDNLNTNIKYNIVKGATGIKFNNEEFIEKISLERYSGEVSFEEIFADAEFSSISFSLESGKDVVKFIYDSDEPYKLEFINYVLNLKLLPVDNGSGTYTISLDNGVQTSLTIEVHEALKSLTLTTTNEDNSVKLKEDSENYSLIYLLNRNNENYFDARLVANGEKNSSAILNVDVISDSASITTRYREDGSFLVYSNQSGSSHIIFKVQGYEITNFVRTNKTIEYVVELITYELADDIYVYKLSDGYNESYNQNTSANYVYVYTNTYNNNLREAKFEVALKNLDAYLFQNPASGVYIPSLFNEEFLYFESESTITQNGKIVKKMYRSARDNIYVLSGSAGEYGTFDTERLIFTANSNLASAPQIKLIAHVLQMGRLYSFTININVKVYNEVERITLQENIEELEFSALEPEKSIIVYPINSNATNGEMAVLISGGKITDKDGTDFYMFTDDSVRYIMSDGKTQIILTVNSDFIAHAANIDTAITGEVLVVAKDWLDVGGNLRSGYSEKAYAIQISFANGTEANRYTINDVNDVLKMKENLSAHYKIKTTIDVSSIVNSFPLGSLSGSIIGLNEYSGFTGINISNGQSSADGTIVYFGLFTTVSESAYIEYVQFAGRFDLQTEEASCIGLIAGENYGRLINIGVNLTSSNISSSLGNCSVGGVVGVNRGEILQDFTLFEDNGSSTRSESLEKLGDKRISYAGKTPKAIVIMNDFVEINITITDAQDLSHKNVGGVAGANYGVIKKVDSNLKFSGYTNYMSYSLIKTNYSSASTMTGVANIYVGGIAGQSEIVSQEGRITGGMIFAGYNEDGFEVYSSYKTNAGGNYQAGKGIIVGGELISCGYVGGVVGKFNGLSNSEQFAGVSTRTFIRGLAGSSSANIALITNIQSLNSTDGEVISNAFAVQAVDDGRILEKSAMAVLYSGQAPVGIGGKQDNIVVFDINRLGFGNYNHKIGSLNLTGENTNVFSYLSREYLEGDGAIINSTNKANYYGDYVVVGSSGLQSTLIFQSKFAKGGAEDLSVNANFNNKMMSENSPIDVFYSYYFAVSSAIDNDLTKIQEDLDSSLNRITPTSSLYPFVGLGEMTFYSNSPEILIIDQMGKIVIKQTGLALITATSLLNSNDSLSFYIYVVNYFNSQSTDKVEDKKSIIYPTASSSSVAVDNTTVELRGNNSATLYVLPNYKFDKEGYNFKSDDRGGATLGGVYFYLAANTEVSARVKIVKNKGALEKEDTEIEYYEKAEEPLEISVIGQTITIRRFDNSEEGIYRLKIDPVLSINIAKNEYTSVVNKVITDTKVDYKYGALDINNKNYNDVPIQTSKKIIEEITIISTDINEKAPLYYILGLDNEALQGNIDKVVYKVSGEDELFKLNFEKFSSLDLGNGTYKHIFKLYIEINRECQIYLNRYNKDIYGRYMLYLQTASNSEKSRLIAIDFEKTNVTSVVIDNFTSLSEINTNKLLSSSSEFAYPGESGLISFTISPEDSDFDYILIENAEGNYIGGHATATFSLVSRYEAGESEKVNKLFEDSRIVGSLTPNGLKITLKELIDAYKSQEGQPKFVAYNGVVYIKYDMSSSNVNDLSKSAITIKVYKDGQIIYNSSKELTIKLQNYVATEIDGKTGLENQGDYYMTYEVARGLKYKLNINSYGFRQDNISVASSSSLGKITFENGSYYLTISDGTIDYNNGGNEFTIETSASQQDGEINRSAVSKTRIIVKEYVVNFNNDIDKNSDIIKGMGDGVINVQVGTQITLGLDIYNYLEYSPTISGVVNKIEEFISSLNKVGTWNTITNLITDDQPDYRMAGSTDEERMEYQLGFNKDAKEMKWSNYYFSSNALSLIPKRTHLPEEKFYFITYEGYFKYENGMYIAKPASGDKSLRKIETTLILSVYSLSSEESPSPIYDYSDFTKMQSGGYYILLNDITLPSVDDEEGGVKAFTPLVGNFASFDGNGHAINFAGTYNMGSLSEIGIFSSLSDSSIIKNLIVNYTSSIGGSDLNTDPNDSIYGLNGLHTVKFITTAESFVFGSLVAENSGIITNCQVFTDLNLENEYYLTIKADNALTSTSYVGGLVGYNNGYITNCGVSINAKMPFNLAGVVAQNNRKVAGCYFKEGKLINNSQYDQHIAGFALINSNDGQIITSYVSGAQSNASLFSTDTNSYIISTTAGGGFIYNNIGKIQDCYTDILLSKTSSDMAGFANINGGIIRNCFSLSILRSNTTASAGFAKEETFEGALGTFENCYYFYNSKSLKDQADEEDKKYFLDEDINVSLYDVKYKGIERLNAKEFDEIDKHFEGYSYDSQMSTKAVWFYSQGYQSNEYVDYIPTTEKIVLPGEDGNNQSNTVYRTQLMTFGKNRLVLVSPNVKVLAVRNFSYSEIDEATGNITYHYVDDSNAPDRGTIHNPRLIYNCNTLENEILNQTSSSHLNITDYRIISDINYNEFEGHSNLYTVTYAGNMEGNGMEISSIALVYMDNRTNGGMFSQIGYSANRIGSVKNLKVSPKEVVFNNTNNVGVLAGTLRYGYIYDINIDASKNGLAVVSGLNFVGGIIGKATANFEAKDIYSNTNVWAVYSPLNDNTYTERNTQDSEYSYAGGLFGFVGRGKVYNAHVNSIGSISGSRTGLAYGGIGEGAVVKYTFANVQNGLKLRANHYAGFIVGEQGGDLSYAYVSNNGSIESSFSSVPKAATGVGGIAGRLNGGTIFNSKNSQSFRISNLENEAAIENVGGLVGIVSAQGNNISIIQDCVVDADVTAAANLGGAVGTISSSLKIDSVAVKSTKLSVTGKRANPRLGGIVGYISNERYAALDMKNSYCNAELELETYTIGQSSIASAGGLIGSAAKTPNLAYCYTTSIIKAKVSDLRALGSLTDFTSMTNEKSSFSHSITSSGSSGEYERVYYLGTSIKGSDVGGTQKINVDGVDKIVANNKATYNANRNIVEYETKVKNSEIRLNVNNYGQSSVDYDSLVSGRDSALALQPRRFYSLFGGKYQIEKEVEVKDCKLDKEVEFIEVANGVSADDPKVIKPELGQDLIYNNDSIICKIKTDKGEIIQNYIKDPSLADTYVYECKEGEGANERIIYKLKLVYKIYKPDIGQEMYHNASGTDSFTFKNGELIQTFERDDDTQDTYFYEFTTGEGDKKIVLYKLSFKLSELCPNIIYRGSDGEYYISKVVSKIEDGVEFQISGYVRLGDDKVADVSKIKLTKIWKTSVSDLSTLLIEDSFDWLDKL